MNEIRIPLPNGTQLIFFQSEQMKNGMGENIAQPVISEEEKLTSKTSNLEELDPEKPNEKKLDQEKLNLQKLNNSAKEEESKDKGTDWPFMMASVNELQEISLALIYYKTYLQGKGQKEKADQIGEIDHKVFQTLQQARQH